MNVTYGCLIPILIPHENLNDFKLLSFGIPANIEISLLLKYVSNENNWQLIDHCIQRRLMYVLRILKSFKFNSTTVFLERKTIPINSCDFMSSGFTIGSPKTVLDCLPRLSQVG